MNFKFENVGCENIKSLNESLENDTAIIYRSMSVIKDSCYAGDINEKIDLTKVISESNKAILKKLKVNISLAKLSQKNNPIKPKYRYINIYTNTAQYLDGAERIGYIYQKDIKDNFFWFSEYSKNTYGSRFSSLWYITKERLQNNNFYYDNEKFIINQNEREKFVSIVNGVIDDFSKGLFEKTILGKVDLINLNQSTYYYHTFEYIQKYFIKK